MSPSEEAQAIIDQAAKTPTGAAMLSMPQIREVGVHFDKEGEPLTFGEWAVLFKDFDYRKVGYTEVGPYFVSTVWIGIEHPGRMLFETMVFSQEVSYSKAFDYVNQHGETVEMGRRPFHESHDERRYRTLEEAVAGHAAAVNEVSLTWEATRHIDPRELAP